MRYLQVSKQTLRNANYSAPAQANSLFPAGAQTDHIHLGVPTSYMDGDRQKFAEDGKVFVTYISFKRNDATWARLNHNSTDGYFSFPQAIRPTSCPAPGWRPCAR